MPWVDVNDVSIHYEITGEGPVLVILNGIMMSTKSWAAHIPVYVKAGYRVLTIDFRDQGESSSSPAAYSILQHVRDLKGVLDYLEMSRVFLLGISYGGQVAMLFALAFPEMVEGLILANTTTKLTMYLKAIGTAWNEAAKLKDGERFFKLAMPLIYSEAFYERESQWLKEREILYGKVLKEEWFERYLRLSSSHDNYNISNEIEQINIPTMVIAADKDIITPYGELLEIHQKIKGSFFIVLPETGHASCYERAHEFNVQVLGFLALINRVDPSKDI